MSKCDCGAKLTSFKNHHAEWCQALTSVTPNTLELYGTLRFKLKKSENSENAIEIYDKETQKRLGYFSYRFSRGQVSLGILSTDPNGDQMKSGLMRCIDWFIESLNDDRIDEFRSLMADARNEWKEQQERSYF